MQGPEATFSVNASRILPAKPAEILRLLGRPELFPGFLPQIKECRVIRRDPLKALTAWQVELDHVPIMWKEEAVFDPKQMTVAFRAVEGDLEQFEGSWRLSEHPSGGTDVWLEARIRIGIPVLSRVVGGVIAEKVEDFFKVLLRSFEDYLSAERYRRIGDRLPKGISGFGVIGHPYNFQHLVSYLRSFDSDFKTPSEGFLSRVFDLMPSYVSYDIKEFRAASGQTTRGAFIACNIIPEMLARDIENVVRKVVESCKVAERLGLGIVALGGFTSIAGERYGDEFRKRINIPVTTGNTLTAALAVEGVLKAARLMELDLGKARVTVIGGTGDIGSACARVLAGMVREVTITSRNPENLKKMEKVIKAVKKAKFRGSHENNEAVRNADIVIAAASSSKSIVEIENFKPGAIVCDIGYPKNIAYAKTDRSDILIFAGGICELPAPFDAGFDLGLPSPDVLYGCFSEAIVLALEGRYENFSWGKGRIAKEKMDEILAMANRHGFKLAPFFWGKRLVTDDEVRAIRVQA